MAISRRQFARRTGASFLTATRLVADNGRLTAHQVVERIRDRLGARGQTGTLAGFKGGDPGIEISGIATTAMATLDVLARASRAKTNLILTLEPVFFSRTDGAAPAAGGGRDSGGVSPDDPVWQAKKEFMRANGLVIFRLGDSWRSRRPDPFVTGLAQALDWTSYQAGADPSRYEIPALSLDGLVEGLASRLKSRAGIRVVGDRRVRVRRIAMLPGVSPLAATMTALSDSDLVLAGETREWESVEYAQDAVAAGQKKGLILLGRVLSEEPGMKVCAEWLRNLVPEVPAHWLPAGDPYWRPA